MDKNLFRVWGVEPAALHDAALHGALDSFLTTMVVDEALTGYQLEVKATRADEIAGRCIVNVAMQPTFSIDYIRVTLALS